MMQVPHQDIYDYIGEFLSLYYIFEKDWNNIGDGVYCTSPRVDGKKLANITYYSDGERGQIG